MSDETYKNRIEDMVEELRDRADLVERHLGETDSETTKQRNEWNIFLWRSIANEIEFRVLKDSQ